MPKEHDQPGKTLSLPYIRGMFRHVLAPPGQEAARCIDAAAQWYVNDHCFFVDSSQTIHWFGITNPYPQDSRFYGPGSHRHIGHATATTPFGPWSEQPDALSLPEGSPENIGACFIVPHGNEYVMIYGYNSGFQMAHSPDLDHWQPSRDSEKIWLGEGTRDPCVVSLPDGTYLLYGAAGREGLSIVGLATSRDLVHWQVHEPALCSDVPGNGGSLESPFVLPFGGFYYLFVNHSHHQYEETLVFASRDPYTFDWQAPVCTLFAHAAEILAFGGKHYISHCGIEDRHWSDTGAPYGLYLAELGWLAEEPADPTLGATS